MPLHELNAEDSASLVPSADAHELRAVIYSIQNRLQEAAELHQQQAKEVTVGAADRRPSIGTGPSVSALADYRLRDATTRQMITDSVFLQTQNEELQQGLQALQDASDHVEERLAEAIAAYEEIASMVRHAAHQHNSLVAEIETEVDELTDERTSLLQGIALSDVALDQQDRHMCDKQDEYDLRLQLLQQEVAEGERLHTEALQQEPAEEANDTVLCGIAAEQRRALDLQSVFVAKQAENKRLENLVREADEQRRQRDITANRQIEALNVELGVLLNENERLRQSLAAEEEVLRERREHVLTLLGGEDSTLRDAFRKVHEQLSLERGAADKMRYEAKELRGLIESTCQGTSEKAKESAQVALGAVLERCIAGLAENRLKTQIGAYEATVTEMNASATTSHQQRAAELAAASEQLLALLSANQAMAEVHCLGEAAHLQQILIEENETMREEVAVVQRREESEIEALEMLKSSLSEKLEAAASEQAQRDVRYGQKLHYLSRLLSAQTATNDELREEQNAVSRTQQAVHVLRVENEGLRLQIQGRIPSDLRVAERY